MKTAKRNIYKAYIQGIQGTTIKYKVYVKRSRMDLLGDQISSLLTSLCLNGINEVRA